MLAGRILLLPATETRASRSGGLGRAKREGTVHFCLLLHGNLFISRGFGSFHSNRVF